MLSPNQSKFLYLLLAFVLTIAACISVSPELSSPQPIATLPVSATALQEDWYTVLFTDPDSPNADTLRGGPDASLAAAINNARISVDIAIYDLNLWSIRDALIRAHQRGVIVRVVTESDNLDEPEIQDLIDAGVPVLGDRREGLMHNKFVIIDRMEVWTGSMNFTMNGAYHNDNNLIRIRSTRLAQDYTSEFEEMFVADQFGASSPTNTPYPLITVDGTQIEVYFSPEDDTVDHLLDVILNAQESIYFLAFSFTSDDLSTALIEQAQHGVLVAGVMEESQYNFNIGTEYDRFLQAGLDVRLDGNPQNMHHKVFIIDGQIVVTGSYNFSASAEDRNDENTLIIHNHDIAAAYLAEFYRVFTLAKK
ncbi:MAG: phospholipase D-like domain-containing protein [Chloroflexota bacterium]